MYNSIVNVGLQDVVNINTGDIIYSEMLTFDIDGYSIGEICSKFRHSRQISRFDIDVFRETFRFIKREHLEDRVFAINMFYETLEILGENKSNIFTALENLIDEYRINTSNIIIELNEEADLENEIIIDNIISLRNLGFRIAIDDWGKQRGSICSLINVLSNKLVDYVKIDIGILKAMKHDIGDKVVQFTESVTDICTHFKVKVIMEGVEDNKEIELIKKCGISYIQGFKVCKKITMKQWLDKENSRR